MFLVACAQRGARECHWRLYSKLDRAQRAEVRTALRRELSKLGASAGPSLELALELGLPCPSEVRSAALAIEGALLARA